MSIFLLEKIEYIQEKHLNNDRLKEQTDRKFQSGR